MVDKKDLINHSDDGCFLGDLRIGLDLIDHSRTFIKGHIWASSLMDVLRFIVNDKLKLNDLSANIIQPIRNIKFLNGIDMSYSPYKNLQVKGVKIPKGFRFSGGIQFLGIDTQAIIDVNLKKLLKLNFEIPSFTIGHDNIEVFSIKDKTYTNVQQRSKLIE